MLNDHQLQLRGRVIEKVVVFGEGAESVRLFGKNRSFMILLSLR